MTYPIPDGRKPEKDMVTSRSSPPISVEDFSRIHGIIRGVLTGVDVAAPNINKSCVFFALAGANLLREKHGLQASAAAGAAFIAVSEGAGGLDILTFAKRDTDSGEWYSDMDAFHAWVHVAGDNGEQWIIDFTSPLYPDLIRQHRAAARPGFKAFIRPASEMIHPNHFSDDGVPGDFFMQEAEAHTAYMMQRADTNLQAADLIGISNEWYVRWPSRVPEYLHIRSSDGHLRELRFKPPRLAGVWTSEASS